MPGPVIPDKPPHDVAGDRVQHFDGPVLAVMDAHREAGAVHDPLRAEELQAAAHRRGRRRIALQNFGSQLHACDR